MVRVMMVRRRPESFLCLALIGKNTLKHPKPLESDPENKSSDKNKSFKLNQCRENLQDTHYSMKSLS